MLAARVCSIEGDETTRSLVGQHAAPPVPGSCARHWAHAAMHSTCSWKGHGHGHGGCKPTMPSKPRVAAAPGGRTCFLAHSAAFEVLRGLSGLPLVCASQVGQTIEGAGLRGLPGLFLVAIEHAAKAKGGDRQVGEAATCHRGATNAGPASRSPRSASGPWVIATCTAACCPGGPRCGPRSRAGRRRHIVVRRRRAGRFDGAEGGSLTTRRRRDETR